jgi:hypothetical protein
MQTTTGGVAVVTTTLAQTDRRALSQAWYSALHLAETTKPGAGKTGAALPAPETSTAGRSEARGASQRLDPGARAGDDARRVVRRFAAPRESGIPPERRLPAGALGRRIAKIIARPAAAPATARSQTVSVRGARIHVIVRTHGNATRIVALCPPPLEARVARALAQARFALAARGVRVEAGA